MFSRVDRGWIGEFFRTIEYSILLNNAHFSLDVVIEPGLGPTKERNGRPEEKDPLRVFQHRIAEIEKEVELLAAGHHLALQELV